jgi:hypothetical protein
MTARFVIAISNSTTDLLSRASEVDGDGKPTVEVLQLEKQNERLKEALVRYVLAITTHDLHVHPC